ncbi:MAG TPA: enoyl-CoA hydratase/isomerase family protein [Deltaproteobacteria bacterium]|nr:enoyl-CoA hydratase/isomerase family protein [Deltaproteobacteria bacterium]
MSFEHLGVSLRHEGRVVLLQLDHGKANEMGSPQLSELELLVRHLTDSPAMALISFSRRVSRRGTPIFVSGANVTERAGWGDEQVKAHVRWQRSVLAALRAAPVFHVVVVEGIALGWGTEFLLTADWRIACDRAVFGLPETGLGIVPGAGGTAELWAEIGIAQTLRLGMTGERIDPDEAMRIGLVQERAPTVDAGLQRALELAAVVMRRSPTAVAAFKEGVLAAVGRAPDERSAIEARAYERCVDRGEAGIGRAHFKEILSGETPPWSPKKLPEESE